MPESLESLVRCWAELMGMEPPTVRRGRNGPGLTARQPAASPERLDRWEQGHGYALPRGLRTWLELSDGLSSADGPVIHPLAAIGPMVPFARVPDLVVQPESWFEIGNPGLETICIDLAYTWPGGGHPVFTSGDDLRRTAPRVIAASFEEWFVNLVGEAGRPYWFDRGFAHLGDPWAEHRQRVPTPPLPERLRPLAPQALPLMRRGVDDRRVAHTLGISLVDVELLFRHLQHAGPG